MRGRMGQSGLTLVELVISMGLFIAFGLMVFQLVRGGLDLWRLGEERRESYERAEVVFDLLRGDLRLVASDPVRDDRVRMVADPYEARLPDGGGLWVPRLRFTRHLPEELRHPVTRAAGEKPGATGYYLTGMTPAEAEKVGLRPPAGLAEVLYLVEPEPGEKGMEGRLQLRRGLRAPPGGEGSFLEESTFKDPEVREATEVVGDGLLHVAFAFWGQGATRWPREGEGMTPGAALPFWDSTRGILARQVFPHALGEGSLRDPTDDVFPSMVRVVLVLDRGSADRASLARDLPTGEREAEIEGLRRLGALEKGGLVKIGGEWVRVERVQSERSLLVLAERGARGTRQAAHPRGTAVRVGRTIVRDIRLPAVREAWSVRRG